MFFTKADTYNNINIRFNINLPGYSKKWRDVITDQHKHSEKLLNITDTEKSFSVLTLIIITIKQQLYS